MVLDPSQMDMLKSFCTLILCGHHEEVLLHCGMVGRTRRTIKRFIYR